VSCRCGANYASGQSWYRKGERYESFVTFGCEPRSFNLVDRPRECRTIRERLPHKFCVKKFRLCVDRMLGFWSWRHFVADMQKHGQLQNLQRMLGERTETRLGSKSTIMVLQQPGAKAIKLALSISRGRQTRWPLFISKVASGTFRTSRERGQFIKCADTLSDTSDIVANGGGFARVYVPEKKLLIDVLETVRNVNYPIWRAAYDSIVQAEQVVHAAA
jgi:hypothetical protein